MNTIKEYELDKRRSGADQTSKDRRRKFFLVYYRSLRIITKFQKERKNFHLGEKEQKKKDQAKGKIKAILKRKQCQKKRILRILFRGKSARLKMNLK